MLLQAELFQLAADSPSVLPNLPRLARYLAAKTQFELAGAGQADSRGEAQACLQNAGLACITEECSTSELASYYDFAFTLEDYDLARTLIIKWARRQPGNVVAIHRRIELELAVGALSTARDQLDAVLKFNPTDSWATAQKKVLIEKIHDMAESVQRH
jgi:hypothetical protein